MLFSLPTAHYPLHTIPKMSEYAFIRVLVFLLVLVPLASAILMPLCGRAARRVALIIALVHLGLSIAVLLGAVAMIEYRHDQTKLTRGDATLQRFHPEFVPGDPGGRDRSDTAEAHTTWTLFHLSTTETRPGKAGPNIQFFLGVDGLNIWLVALASFMLIPVVLISWESVKDKPGAYFGWLFLLQTGLIGCFLSFDVILFYLFFELTLIPSFFLIGRWGIGSGRRDAARKFFLYTLAGSLLTLLGVIGVVLTNPIPVDPFTSVPASNAAVQNTSTIPLPGHVFGEWKLAKAGPITFSLPDLMANVQVWANAEAHARRAVDLAEQDVKLIRAQPKVVAEDVGIMETRLSSAREMLVEAQRIRARQVETQFWFFIALMAGFMVKVPIWPFHTWLPSAYGEAPTGVAMMLSAVMAKLGTFGILRLVLPLVPDAAINYGLPVVGALAAVGIIYTAFCAFAAKDIKLLVAYSSISHLGFLVLGLFAFNREGLTGAVLHMVNHGLSIGALFGVVGFLMFRYRTTDMAKFSGLMGRFPAFAVLTFVLCLASIGLPGLNNFVSEMMMLAGLFDADNPGVRGSWPAVVAVLGIFLSAWYTLTMLRRCFFGPVKEPEPVAPEATSDVTRQEFFALATLAILCLMLGLFPQPVIDTLKPDVRVLANIGDNARARTRGVPYESKEEIEEPSAAPNRGQQPKGGKGGNKGGKGGNFKGGKGGKGGFPKGGKGGGKGGMRGPMLEE